MNLISFSLYLLSIITPSSNYYSDGMELDSIIKQSIHEAYTNQKLPGIIVGIKYNTETKYYTEGYANYKEQTPLRNTQLAEIGSISKTFTAYIIQALLYEHHISLDKAITEYLPDSIRANSELSSITFRKLLNHTSGLPRLDTTIFVTATTPFQPYENYTKKDLYNYLITHKADSEGYSYSNLGYALLGLLAENISGNNYNNLLKKYVYKPFKIKVDTSATKITPYIDDYEEAEYWNMAVHYPAGGIVMSAENLMQYVISIAEPKNKLSNNVYNTLNNYKTIPINLDIGISICWHTVNINNNTVFWHNGGTYGFSTFCAFSPKTKNAVVIIINRANENITADGLGTHIIKQLETL